MGLKTQIPAARSFDERMKRISILSDRYAFRSQRNFRSLALMGRSLILTKRPFM